MWAPLHIVKVAPLAMAHWVLKSVQAADLLWIRLPKWALFFHYLGFVPKVDVPNALQFRNEMKATNPRRAPSRP
jgi:hypothetical protein